jgi:hypothetical protein
MVFLFSILFLYFENYNPKLTIFGTYVTKLGILGLYLSNHPRSKKRKEFLDFWRA